MCVTVIRKAVTAEPIRAWKLVARNPLMPGVYLSMTNPAYRERQDGSLWRGRRLTYELGKVVRSPFYRSAGVYVYLSMPAYYKIDGDVACIEVEIPAGTKVNYGMSTAMAAQVRVVREVSQAEAMKVTI